MPGAARDSNPDTTHANGAARSAPPRNPRSRDSGEGGRRTTRLSPQTTRGHRRRAPPDRTGTPSHERGVAEGAPRKHPPRGHRDERRSGRLRGGRARQRAAAPPRRADATPTVDRATHRDARDRAREACDSTRARRGRRGRWGRGCSIFFILAYPGPDRKGSRGLTRRHSHEKRNPLGPPELSIRPSLDPPSSAPPRCPLEFGVCTQALSSGRCPLAGPSLPNPPRGLLPLLSPDGGS